MDDFNAWSGLLREFGLPVTALAFMAWQYFKRQAFIDTLQEKRVTENRESVKVMMDLTDSVEKMGEGVRALTELVRSKP